MAEKAIETPCIQVCTLDENQICIGCGRTIDEIARWTSMTDEERREVMERLEQVKSER